MGQGRTRVRGRGIAGVASACLVAAVLAAPASASEFEVNTLGDPGTGDCDASECTLREAIAAAKDHIWGDTVTFAPGLSGTIRLTDGELEYVDDDKVTIEGPGADVLTISADADGDGEHDLPGLLGPGDSRILEIRPMSPDDLSGANISGVTLAGGTVDGNGGAISSTDTQLIMQDVRMVDNFATGEGGALYSDGVYWLDGVARGNAALGDGGAIAVTDEIGPGEGSGLTRLAISGNHSAMDGGGVSLVGDAYVRASTINDNEASNGGGVFLRGVARLLESTVSGNEAAGRGGGVYAVAGPDPGDIGQLNESTIADNHAAVGGGAFGLAAGPGASTGALTNYGAILADNTAPDGPDVAARGTDGAEARYYALNSIVENGPEPVPIPVSRSYVGVDPQLGPLADNGGPTLTHMPAPTSVAIDATDYGEDFDPLPGDQRGLPRHVDAVAGNIYGSNDIGAVERQDPGAIGDDDIRPDTEITEHPPAIVRYRGHKPPRVRIGFTGTDDRTSARDLGFQCQLGKESQRCEASFRARMKPGRHIFKVRATDPAGNADRTAAKFSFLVKKRQRR